MQAQLANIFLPTTFPSSGHPSRRSAEAGRRLVFGSLAGPCQQASPVGEIPGGESTQRDTWSARFIPDYRGWISVSSLTPNTPRPNGHLPTGSVADCEALDDSRRNKVIYTDVLEMKSHTRTGLRNLRKPRALDRYPSPHRPKPARKSVRCRTEQVVYELKASFARATATASRLFARATLTLMDSITHRPTLDNFMLKMLRYVYVRGAAWPQTGPVSTAP